jgi:hypothetical protein
LNDDLPDSIYKVNTRIELPKLKNFKMLDVSTGVVTANSFKGHELLRKFKLIEDSELSLHHQPTVKTPVGILKRGVLKSELTHSRTTGLDISQQLAHLS